MLINQSHLNSVGLDNVVLTRLCNKLSTIYKTRIVKHGKGAFIMSSLRHVKLDEAINALKDKDINVKLLKLKALIEEHDGVIPETTEDFQLQAKEISKINTRSPYKSRAEKVALKKQRKSAFLAKWRECYDI